MAVAESAERQVLKELGAETLAWTGDESLQTMTNASNLLTASWDTMGWILYLNQKYAEAEQYIRAAWLYRSEPEVGEHLGDVQMALHQDKQARMTYYLASLVAAKTNPDRFPELKKKSAAAVQAEQDLTSIRPAEAWRQEHSFPVSSAPGLSGTAAYRLVFTRDSVISVKPEPGGSTAAQDAAVRTAKLAAFFPANESAALMAVFTLTCKDGACTLVAGR